jgi:protein import protein ZIM17
MPSGAAAQIASPGVQHSLVAGKPEVGQLSQVYQRYALQRFGTVSDSMQSSDGEEGPAAIGKLPNGPQDKNMMAVFTCRKCDTRSAKVFSRQSYEKGIVIVQCAGCEGRHLIADRLGWFGDPTFTLDKFLEQKGEAVMRKSEEDGTLEVTPEELMGSVKARELGLVPE